MDSRIGYLISSAVNDCCTQYIEVREIVVMFPDGKYIPLTSGQSIYLHLRFMTSNIKEGSLCGVVNATIYYTKQGGVSDG